MPIRTIIVEDEPLSRGFLNNLLTEFCPEVEVVAKAASEEEAIKAITKLNPDLVFLDIELQQGTGFDVLKRLGCPDFHVIFTTAFDHYSIKAIQFSGADYLLKPIDMEGLQQSIRGVIAKKNTGSCKTALTHLYNTLQNKGVPAQIYLPTAEGADYVAIGDIIRIEAESTGSLFYLSSGKMLRVMKSLKEYESLLSAHRFFRPHHAHLVNLEQVDSKENFENGSVRMNDKSIVPVSPKRKDEMKELLSKQRVN